tara:strand:+ start:132 stop:719 length:588 start_codon:yes stop_codon:yes gene_type:complete
VEIKKIKSFKNKIIEGPLLLKPNKYLDSRGYFFESWNQNLFNESIGKNINFVQDNHSRSLLGVIRGLHFQIPPFEQGKLVRVTNGAIIDVIVDIRLKSKTFGEWAGVSITEKNNEQLWIPEGFAHGFLSISKIADLHYKTTNYWNKKCERTLLWNDNSLNIKWNLDYYGIQNPTISEKDSQGEFLDKLKVAGEIF